MDSALVKTAASESAIKTSASAKKKAQKKTNQAVARAKKKEEKEKEQANVTVPTPKRAKKAHAPTPPPLPLAPEQSEFGERKTLRYRLYPTVAQRKKLNAWIDATRWTYNRCVAALKEKVVAHATMKDLRAHTVNIPALIAGGFEWATHVPANVRDEGMQDVIKAIASNVAKMKAQKGKPGALTKFELSFRSKRLLPQESIVIRPNEYAAKTGMFSSLFAGGTALRARTKGRRAQPMPAKLLTNTRIVRTRLGNYYMCVVLPLKPPGSAAAQRSENQAPDARVQPNSVAAIDPGVNTFGTVYDADGQGVEWGKADRHRIEHLCHYYDVLQGKWSHKDVRHAQRYRMRRAGMRIQKRIRDLVDELHKHMAKWLCENYRVILLPKFDTASMAARVHPRTKRRRRISGRTARAMCTWSHYRFRQRLMDKAREYPWCRVVLCDEAYTSCTCGRCGTIKKDLGGERVFRCPSRACGYVVGRDINGAMNVLRRFLTRHCDVAAAAAAAAASQ